MVHLSLCTNNLLRYTMLQTAYNTTYSVHSGLQSSQRHKHIYPWCDHRLHHSGTGSVPGISVPNIPLDTACHIPHPPSQQSSGSHLQPQWHWLTMGQGLSKINIQCSHLQPQWHWLTMGQGFSKINIQWYYRVTRLHLAIMSHRYTQCHSRLTKLHLAAFSQLHSDTHQLPG